MGVLLQPKGRPPRTFLQKFYEGACGVRLSLVPFAYGWIVQAETRMQCFLPRQAFSTRRLCSCQCQRNMHTSTSIIVSGFLLPTLFGSERCVNLGPKDNDDGIVTGKVFLSLVLSLHEALFHMIIALGFKSDLIHVVLWNTLEVYILKKESL